MGFSVSLDWLQRLSLLKHSRTMETEADIISLHLLGITEFFYSFFNFRKELFAT